MRSPWVVFGMALLLAGPAEAAEWHVSAGAAGGGTGTQASPFSRISDGMAVAVSGDTVWIHAGKYAEELIPPRSGLSSQPITIAAWPGDSGSPVITAFRQIIPGVGGVGSWQSVTGGRWSISLPVGSYLADGYNLVAVDGALRQEARWPDTPRIPDFTRDHAAWSTAGSLLSENDSGTLDLGQYVCPSLTSLADGGLVGTRMLINPGKQWFPQNAILQTKVGDTVTFQWERWGGGTGGFGATSLLPSQQDWFLLTGRLALLSRTDEFHLELNGADGAVGTLWLQQPLSPAGSQVEIRQTVNTANLGSRTDLVLRGLRFHGGRVYAGAASRRIRIEGCTVQMDGPGLQPEPGIYLDGSGHQVVDCDIMGASGTGIALGSACQNTVIDNCTVRECGNSGITATLGASSLTIARCTVWDVGAHGVLANSYDTDYDHLNIYHWGQRCADVGGINVWENFTRPLNVRIHHSWVHDTMGYEQPGGRWTAGAGIRGDAGGNNGVSGYTIDHCLVRCGAGIDISAFALNATQIGADNPDIRILSNTAAGAIDLTAVSGTLTGGFTVLNNIGRQVPPDWTNSGNDRSGSNLELRKTAPKLSDLLAGDWTPAAGSPLVDAGDPSAPFQAGYRGAGPDLGALEQGDYTWVPGAVVTVRQRLNLRVEGRYRHDDVRFAVLTGLPSGRMLPATARLTISGVPLGTAPRWAYDTSTNTGEAWFSLPTSPPADGPVVLDLGDGTPALPLASDSVGVSPTITGLTIDGDRLVVNGSGFASQHHDRYRLDLPGLTMDDLLQRPIVVQCAPAVAGIHPDGANLGLELGIGAMFVPVAVEVERYADASLQGWAALWTAPTMFGPALQSTVYAYATSDPIRQPVTTVTWPIVADASLSVRLRPETLNPGRLTTVAAGGISFTASATAAPDLQTGRLAGLPAFRFDGAQGLTWASATTLADGPATAFAVYRNVDSATDTAPTGPWQRLISVGPEQDFKTGFAMIVASNPQGQALPAAVPTSATVLAAGAASRSPIVLGRNTNRGTYTESFTGWLGEVLIYSRALEWSEFQQVQRYFDVKYQRTATGRITGRPLSPISSQVIGSLGGYLMDLLSASESRLEYTLPSGVEGGISVRLPDGLVLTPSGTTVLPMFSSHNLTLEGTVSTSLSYPLPLVGSSTLAVTATGAMPPGLFLDRNGVIYGTPMIAGIWSIGLVASNRGGIALTSLSVSIRNSPVDPYPDGRYPDASGSPSGSSSGGCGGGGAVAVVLFASFVAIGRALRGWRATKRQLRR